MKDVIDLLGRILLSAIFIYEAYDTVAHWSSTRETLTTYGLLWRQDLLIAAAGLILLLGGILLLIGYRVILGSVMLLMYWVPVSLIIHSYWNDPAEFQRLNAILLMKNLAIAGGLLMMIANGSGRYSVKRLITVLKIDRKKL